MSRDEKVARKKLLQEPDEFLSLSQRVILWAHENRTRALAIAGGAAAVLLVAVLAKALVERSREQRSDPGPGGPTRSTGSGEPRPCGPRLPG